MVGRIRPVGRNDFVENRLPEIQDVLVYAPSGDSVRGVHYWSVRNATDLDESELVVDYIWMNGNTVLDIERGIIDSNVMTLSSGNAVRGNTIVCQSRYRTLWVGKPNHKVSVTLWSILPVCNL